MRLWKRAWPPSRIGLRLLAFNLLVVFVPVVGVLYLDIYETQLLSALEREMVQQGRLLAAAAASNGALDVEEVTRVLVRLGRQSDARFRVYDASGALIADSAKVVPFVAAPATDTQYGSSSAADGVRTRFLYRVGAALAGVRQRGADVLRAVLRPRVRQSAAQTADEIAPEVRAALAGGYGAATRQTPGQRSLTLFSAVPVSGANSVIGAVVVSQSTFRVLQAIYDVRLRIFEVVVASIFAAAVLTTLAATTIVRPLRRLRRQAAALTERRGPLPATFPGSARKDEIGDLARALEELTRRVNDQIGALEGFSADVSHEFKNPLASIRTAAEMVAQSEHAEDRDRFLTMMLRDVSRLERLVTGAREVARIDGALETESVEPVSIASAIIDAVDSVRAVHHGCVVRLEPVDERIGVRASPARLSQVFENLLSNAVSFSPPGSAVDVNVSATASCCTVRVSDRGPGIPVEHISRIFDRFFSYRPTSGRGEHVGLGLAIARRIVEGYGGTIGASNRDGGGATFEVSLPAISLRARPAFPQPHRGETVVASHSARSAVSGSTRSARRDGM